MKQFIAFGMFIMLLLTAFSGRAQNTKYGTYALQCVHSDAYFNSGFGYEALRYTTTGLSNSAFGHNALKTNVTGNSNAAFGESALLKNFNGGANVAMGNWALLNNNTGSFNTAMGTWALVGNTTGSYNTGLGMYSLWYNQSGSENTALGFGSMMGFSGNNAGNRNTAVGNYSLLSNRADENSAFGHKSMYYNTSGFNNTAFGAYSLEQNKTGNHNAAFGNYALNKSKSISNCAFGYLAASTLETGNYNCAFGVTALKTNLAGHYNVAMGLQALHYATGSSNTGIGAMAGNNSVSSEACSFLGHGSDVQDFTSSYTNSTAIGHASRITASNQISLGNSSVSSIGGFSNWTNFSDGRFKKEVSEQVPGLEFINKLRPVTYHLDVDGLAGYLHEDPLDSVKAQYSQALSDAIVQGRKAKAAILETGFIAQEVETAAQSIGYDFSGVDKPTNESDLYGLRYAAFTVPLVKSVQELAQENAAIRAENESLKQTLESVLERLNTLEKQVGERSESTSDARAVRLDQNRPNPMKENSLISMYVPENTRKAVLKIWHENGQLAQTGEIHARGEVTYVVSSAQLPTGLYYYTLVLDGETVGTMKMVVVR